MRTLLLMGLLAVAAPAAGDEIDAIAEGPSLEEIEECVRDNTPEKTSRQVVTFRAVDHVGEETVSNAEIWWQKFDAGDRALVSFYAPPNLRGSSLLLIQKEKRADMFMYLPELRKTRRVNARTLHGSMFGTDFSYEDFERLQGFTEDPDTTLLPDDRIEGRVVHVLDIRPAPEEDSQYERITTFVDRERCVPLRVELFEKGDRLAKVLTTPPDRVTREGSVWVPRVARLDDREHGSHTVLTVDEIEVDAEIPRKLFSERELQSSGR